MSLMDDGMRAADRLVATAKRNPEGVLLVAAGVALLMRGIGAASNALRESRGNGNGYRGAADENGDGRASHRRDFAETARGYASEARDYASDLTGRVKQSTEEMVHYADEMRRAAAERTGQAVRQTRAGFGHAVDRMMEEQPLTLALLGLAAGAVVASALPPTRVERRTLGDVGERLTETAEEAGRRLKKSAAKAGKRMGEVAEKRGLTARNLKGAAKEVADGIAEDLSTEAEPDRTGTKGSRRTRQGQESSGPASGLNPSSMMSSTAMPPSVIPGDEASGGKTEDEGESGMGSRQTGQVG